jgi:serine/threonine protein kinase
MGSSIYISPEAMLLDKQVGNHEFGCMALIALQYPTTVSPAQDVWSMAVLICVALSGSFPWELPSVHDPFYASFLIEDFSVQPWTLFSAELLQVRPCSCSLSVCDWLADVPVDLRTCAATPTTDASQVHIHVTGIVARRRPAMHIRARAACPVAKGISPAEREGS